MPRVTHKQKVFFICSIITLVILLAGLYWQQKYRSTTANITEPATTNNLSPNARSYFKLFSILHDGTRYTRSFASARTTWLQEHIDQATSQVAGNASSLKIPVNRYTNWRDFSTVDAPNFSFETLLVYYQNRNQDVDNAFVHVASDTSFVRYTAPSHPLPSMNDRLQRVLTVSSSSEQATTLPAAAARQDVTHTAYGDQNVPTMPHDFTLAINNTDIRYIMMGHAWKFDQINFNVTTAATAGWQTKFEYWSGTAWLPLTTISDSTSNFNQSGRVHFSPPADWSTAKLSDDLAAYYWLRFSETSLTGSVTLTAHKSLETSTNWDGVPAINLTPYATTPYSTSRQNVIIPGWDAANDINHDGYVDDTEFNNRPNQLASARFRYQSQLPAAYLVGRWESNYADPTYQQFASDRARQLLADTQTRRLFVDNGYTNLMLPLSLTLPDITTPSPTYLEYSDDAALQQSAADFLTALKGSGADYILLNGALSQPATIPAINGLMLENELTLPHSAQEKPETLALFWNQLKIFSNARKEVIVGAKFDSDKRAQLYNLARYYLTATPYTYYWTQSGAPWSSWSDLMSRDLGNAVGDYQLIASDTAHHSYIYRRDFTLGSVIVKTMTAGANTASDIGEDTKYHIDLGERFYPVGLNNQIQSSVTGLDLRNYEAAILLKNQPPVWDSVDLQTVKTGETLRLALPVSDPEGSTLELNIAESLTGASIETNETSNLLTYTTTESSIGSHTIVLKASDGDKESNKTIDISVSDKVKTSSGTAKTDSSGSQSTNSTTTQPPIITDQSAQSNVASTSPVTSNPSLTTSSDAVNTTDRASFQVSPQANKIIGIAASIFWVIGLFLVF
ncbi:MAG: putative glycoside hydrolase [bacterium]|nr:putative glycoside hydrolase [bacterium]